MTNDFDLLRDYLVTQFELRYQHLFMAFDEIEAMVGTLPAGASHQKSWWHGTGSAQAKAWRDAGWAVDTVGFAAKRVAFRRIN
jgi:hypothetical protein